MENIFNADYRKDALALLIEAGVEKKKAIEVVSTKFYKALTNAAADVLTKMAEDVRSGKDLTEVLKNNSTLKETTGFESMVDVATQLEQLKDYVTKEKKEESKKGE